MTDRASRVRFFIRSMVVCGVAALHGAVGCSGDGTSPRVAAKDGGAADAASVCSTTPPEPIAKNDAGRCPDAPMGPTFLPCDVEAILKAKCQRCHTSTDVLARCSKKTPATETTPEISPSCVNAPFPLLEWADTRKPLPGTTTRPIDLMHEAIESDFMPLKVTTIEPAVEPLTADEKQTLLDWIDGCAPPVSKPCCSK